MSEINIKLARREAEDNPIQVAVIGCGQMGTEIITQIGEMKGMDVVVVVDLDEKRARAGYAASKKTQGAEIVFTDNPAAAADAVAAGKKVATSKYKVAIGLPSVESVVDATGSTYMGALTSLACIDAKKHIVMMNVECDVTIGPIIRRMAENAGVVYSLAAGDEPAAIVELWRFATALGFEIIAAGKGKNNPLNIYATPDTEQEKADERKMSSRMLCEFVDGSKTAIEMAAVSNATGLKPDIRGMHCAHAKVPDLNTTFIPKKDGGILNSSGIVDFAIGVHPGVFLVVKTDNKRIMEGMGQRDMGDGPYYTLYRPYHLCSVEVPITIAQGVFYGESSGHPKEKLSSECIAVAKRDLKAGWKLDGIGEFDYRVSIDHAEIAKSENLLPAGLALGCTLKEDVPIDSVLTWDMIETPNDSALLDLRRIQDRLYST